MAATVSGLLLLFEDEYYRWRYPALPDSPGLIQPAAQVIAAIVSNSAGRLTALGLPTDGLPAYHAYFADGSEALFHPESGSLVDEWRTFDALPAFFFHLHVYLLLGEAGHLLVGALGLFAAANVMLGIALWLRRRKVFRIRHAVPRGPGKKHLLRGHAGQGTVFGAVFVVLILCGSAIVFPEPVQAVLYRLPGTAETLRPTISSAPSATAAVDWKQALATTGARFPDARPRFISPPAEPGRPLVIRLQNDGEMHPNGRSYVVLDPATGSLLESIDATKTGLGPAIFDSLYPIHSGKTGWPGYRILLVVTSLSLMYIAVSGTYLFLSRPKRPGAPGA